jgi:hypothetical protein
MGTLPTPEKTWQFAHIAPTPSGTMKRDLQNVIYDMKEALKSFGSAPWTCAGSNDGVTAAMDGVDRITDPTKLDFTGVTGASWIVMEAPSGWGGGQVLFYGNSGGAFSLAFYTKFSLGGNYTGGTTTTLPTATDEDFPTAGNGNDIFQFSGFGSGKQCTAHVMHSTDGQHTRVFFADSNESHAFWAVETAGAAGSLWTPARFYGRGPLGNLNALTSTLTWNIGQNWMRAKSPVGSLGLGAFGYLTAIREIHQVTLINDAITIPNEISGENPLYPIGLYGNPFYITGLRGRCGYIKDWWCTDNTVSAGDGFPGNGDKDLMSFGGGVVVPWDGTTPVLG